MAVNIYAMKTRNHEIFMPCGTKDRHKVIMTDRRTSIHSFFDDLNSARIQLHLGGDKGV